MYLRTRVYTHLRPVAGPEACRCTRRVDLHALHPVGGAVGHAGDPFQLPAGEGIQLPLAGAEDPLVAGHPEVALPVRQHGPDLVVQEADVASYEGFDLSRSLRLDRRAAPPFSASACR